MKNFIVKLFSLICAVIFLSQSAVLFLIWSGRVSLRDIIDFGNSLLQTSRHADILAGSAIAFLSIGLIFFYRAMKRTVRLKAIVVKNKGEIVRIPVNTVRDFVYQIIEKNPYLKEPNVVIHKKGKWIYINVLCAYTGETPVQEEINTLKEILRGEIGRVFGFSYLKIDFQLEGIRITYSGADFESEESDGTLDDNEALASDQQPDSTSAEAINQGSNKQMPWER